MFDNIVVLANYEHFICRPRSNPVLLRKGMRVILSWCYEHPFNDVVILYESELTR